MLQDRYIDPRACCRYKHGTIGYVRYKEEILSDDPWIVMYYDIISDAESRALREMAESQVGHYKKTFNPKPSLWIMWEISLWSHCGKWQKVRWDTIRKHSTRNHHCELCERYHYGRRCVGRRTRPKIKFSVVPLNCLPMKFFLGRNMSNANCFVTKFCERPLTCGFIPTQLERAKVGHSNDSQPSRIRISKL